MRFLLVDALREVEPGRRIRGAKCAAMSEDYFTWHFPERPIVPGMLILEAFVQLAGWLEAATSDFEAWVLLDRVPSARYYRFAGPGDVLDLELAVTAAEGDRRAYRGESRRDGERGALVEFEARVVPLETLDDPAAVRRAYAVLRGEDERTRR